METGLVFAVWTYSRPKLSCFYGSDFDISPNSHTKHKFNWQVDKSNANKQKTSGRENSDEQNAQKTAYLLAVSG